MSIDISANCLGIQFYKSKYLRKTKEQLIWNLSIILKKHQKEYKKVKKVITIPEPGENLKWY